MGNPASKCGHNDYLANITGGHCFSCYTKLYQEDMEARVAEKRREGEHGTEVENDKRQ